MLTQIPKQIVKKGENFTLLAKKHAVYFFNVWHWVPNQFFCKIQVDFRINFFVVKGTCIISWNASLLGILMFFFIHCRAKQKDLICAGKISKFLINSVIFPWNCIWFTAVFLPSWVREGRTTAHRNCSVMCAVVTQFCAHTHSEKISKIVAVWWHSSL